MTTLASVAGLSALVAAAATVVGAITLLVSSTWFPGWLGLDLVAGRLAVGALGVLAALGAVS